MARAVKSTRTYNSPRRRAQAEATRQDILEAAERLFAEQGYASTTMAAIAREARVSLKTIYLALGTKSEVLRKLWNLRLRGGTGDAPVAERSPFQAMLAEPDPRRMLRLNAAFSRAAKVRIGPLFAVIHEGAGVDPDIAALWKRIETEFHAHQRKLAESLHDKRALKKG